jgi:hypothetical protein
MSRCVCIATLFVLTFLAASRTEPVRAQDGPVISSTGDGELTLRELLEKELRAKREVEITFIQRVVDRVEEKKIPLKTVMIMYKWSKTKSNRPYQYFEKGMKVQAKRLGVDLLARAEENPQGGFRNFFRDMRIRFKRLSVRF